MALTIEQIAAVSYPAVVAEMRKPANQWADTSALNVLEKKGFIDKRPMGETIEAPVDYRPNPDGGVMASDQDQSPLLKTEVITAASYAIGQVSYKVVWTRGDDVKNPTENQKVSLVKSLLENGINTHDDLLEQLIFTTSSAGGDEVLGLDTLVPDSGQGSPGGISAVTETWWRNFADTYTDASDIEAAMVEAWNEAAKGSGSQLMPTLLISGSDPHALYESALQANIRFASNKEGDSGFLKLQFKNADYIFSQYGDDHIYFLNPKNYMLVVARNAFRDKGNTYPVTGQEAFYFSIYSAVQFITNNKSRLAVLSQA